MTKDKIIDSILEFSKETSPESAFLAVSSTLVAMTMGCNKEEMIIDLQGGHTVRVEVAKTCRVYTRKFTHSIIFL